MFTEYSQDFYEYQADGSARSAEVIVDLFLKAFPRTASVIDVGCGVGGWLAAFTSRGITDVTGLDGPYVPTSMLRIPAERFISTDLSVPLPVDRRRDVAISLEVAEHLSPAVAETFVDGLTRLAPVVLFSAAIPRQGGVKHFNERWQSYWAELFAGHGYVALDFIRPRIFESPEVEWWYQQNTLVFCTRDRVPVGMTPVSDRFTLDRIHPQVIEKVAAAPHTGTEAVVAVRRSIAIFSRVARKRLGKLVSVRSPGRHPSDGL